MAAFTGDFDLCVSDFFPLDPKYESDKTEGDLYLRFLRLLDFLALCFDLDLDRLLELDLLGFFSLYLKRNTVLPRPGEASGSITLEKKKIQ